MKSLWENIIADLDSQIFSECDKLVLENFIKLYVQVWSFSYARDIVSKYKLKEKSLRSMALRKELKMKIFYKFMTLWALDLLVDYLLGNRSALGKASTAIWSCHANFKYYHYSFLSKLIVFTVYEHKNICIA